MSLITTTIHETQQKNRESEQNLFIDLQKIYIKIKRDPDFPLYTSSIYQKYYNLISAAIRKTIESVHRSGIEYVGSKLKQDVYFTNTDIEVIKVQTEFTTNLFFKALNKESEIIISKFQNSQLKGAADIDINETQSGILAAIKKIVVSAITIAFARSILSKSNQLPEGLSFTQTSSHNRKVRWVTAADERVCPICFPLHNQIFYASDSTVPIPGTLGSLGSHPNCRCYYQLL